MTIEAGRLNQRVMVQRLVETRDAYGQPVKTWISITSVWAEVLTFGGGEPVNAERVQADATHTVTMRYCPSLFASPGLLPSMRLRLGSSYLEIINVKDVDFLHVEYRLSCRQLVSPNPA